jgi:hypothetical protein
MSSLAQRVVAPLPNDIALHVNWRPTLAHLKASLILTRDLELLQYAAGTALAASWFVKIVAYAIMSTTHYI